MDWLIIIIVAGVIGAIAIYLMIKSLNTVILKDDMLSKISKSVDIKLSKTQAIYSKELYLYTEKGNNLIRAGVIMSSMVINFEKDEYVLFNVKVKPLYFGLFNILNNIFQIKRNFVYFLVKFEKCIYNQQICFIKTANLEEFNILDTTYFYEPQEKNLVVSFIYNEFDDIQLLLAMNIISKNELNALKLRTTRNIRLQKEAKL